MQTLGRPCLRTALGAVIRAAIAGLLAAAFVLMRPVGLAGPALAADLAKAPAALLMIEDRGCPYCARWDREVRDSYLNSAEGRFAPLVRRPRGSTDIAFVRNVIYSPTFVVLVRGHEIGRIIGYQGADFFWAELGSILMRGGFESVRSGS